MKYFLGLFLLLPIADLLAITITEGNYRGKSHFIVYTKNATYYYDKAGGGFSRIVDKSGRDWIDFKAQPWNKYPESAISSYRGLPNFVHGSTDHGVGHPGYEKCESEKISKRSIRTTSLSGKWQWTWTFYKRYAEVKIEKVDPNHKYWFVYNGVIGGKYNPENQYYGTNLGGPRFDIYDFYKGEKLYGSWLWAYFGDRDIKRVFFVAMEKQDPHVDSYSYLGESKELGAASGNGMSVFGFGSREDFTPLMTHQDIKFYIGFINRRVEKGVDHLRMKKIIESFIGR